MAKIGNIEFAIGEKWPRPYPLYYTQKWKFEIRGIDEDFFNLTGVSNTGYSTELELKQTITKAIPIYHEKKKKERLVIGYRCFSTPALTMNEVTEGSYQGRIEGVSKKIMSFPSFKSPYCAVGIDYDIYMEIFNGKKNEYFRVDENHKVNSKGSIHWEDENGRVFIDFTPENFEFFENLKKGMQTMVKKMSMFFDLNSEEAQALIGQNNNLLN